MAGIKFWNEDDRPREKMIHKGADALSNSELLAILINNGLKNALSLFFNDVINKCIENRQIL